MEQMAFIKNDVIMNEELTFTTKHLYFLIVLESFSKNNKCVTFKANKYSDTLKVSVRTIMRIIDTLVENELLNKKSIKGKHTVLELINLPNKENDIKFTQIGRSAILSFESEVVCRYATLKMIYDIVKNDDITKANDLKKMTMAYVIGSPYYKSGDIINEIEYLNENGCKLVSFKYKLEVFEEPQEIENKSVETKPKVLPKEQIYEESERVAPTRREFEIYTIKKEIKRLNEEIMSIEGMQSVKGLWNNHPLELRQKADKMLAEYKVQKNELKAKLSKLLEAGA